MNPRPLNSCNGESSALPRGMSKKVSMDRSKEFRFGQHSVKFLPHRAFQNHLCLCLMETQIFLEYFYLLTKLPGQAKCRPGPTLGRIAIYHEVEAKKGLEESVKKSRSGIFQLGVSNTDCLGLSSDRPESEGG